MDENYEGDYRCAVSEGEDPCRSVACLVYREPWTPAAVAVIACAEHGVGLKAEGYRFDREATIQLSRDIEREMEVMA